ncbi:Uncharacterised protein [Gallibacterium anatis]|uniref:Uncharacterized protein n=1 Tax=Gallibacterium anatis TaxID=750 RepID=A0A377H5C8_9PAST|nr:hypothetical protein [Gallibacterium anatis]STO37558.1 Uncharacterised protein [Gallibacterium anatis]STO61187.1 Uncharacterised protein [Gallibacterium anatis]
MVLFYIVIDFSPTSTTTNARSACALYLRPEGQSFTALFDKILGHASSNVGDSVYTHKTLIHLRKVINLLK